MYYTTDFESSATTSRSESPDQSDEPRQSTVAAKTGSENDDTLATSTTTPPCRADEDDKFLAYLQKPDTCADLVAADKRSLTLNWAVRTNHPAIVALLATHGANLEARDATGRTALSWAAGNGHVEVLSYLLDHGADASTRDAHQRTPLWWAACNGHNLAVQQMLDHDNVDAESPNEHGRTVLMCAAEKGYEAVVRVLLEGKNKALVNAEDPQGRTALSWAAGGDRDKAATYLMGMGADTEIQDIHGRTPLLWAAAEGHVAVTTTLLDHNADVECPDAERRTALSWAAGKGQEGVVQLLLQCSGIVVDTQDKRGRTPLSWAAGGGHEAVVELLIKWAKDLESSTEKRLRRYKEATPLEFAMEFKAKQYVISRLAQYGLDIDTPDDDGRTPLSWAAGNGHRLVAAVLVELGADVEAEDVNSRTPFWWAAANGRVAVVKMLLEKYGVDPKREDRNGENALSTATIGGYGDVVSLLDGTGAGQTVPTPSSDYDDLLWWAVKGGHETAVELLLRQGADPNAANPKGSQPLAWAAASGHDNMARLLIEGGANLEAEACLDGAFYGQAVTPLYWAAMKGHVDMVEYLLAKGANLKWKYYANKTPLAEAAGNGHSKVVDQLLRHGADLGFGETEPSRSWSSWPTPDTPLAMAVAGGHIEIAKTLINYGVEVLQGRPYEEHDRKHWNSRNSTDYPDSHGRTLLSWAAQVGHEAAVRRLISMPHVDVNISEDRHCRPVSWAAMNGHETIVELLLDNQAEVGFNDIDNETPFTLAFKNGHRELAIRLFDKAVEALGEKDRAQASSFLLSWAAQMGLLSRVSMLLSQFHDCPDLSKPLKWAAMSGHGDIVRYLLEQGAPIPSEGAQYSWQDPGLLSGAALNGHEAVVELLLERGADPNGEESEEGIRPLGRAACTGQLSIAKLLLKHGADPNLPRTSRRNHYSLDIDNSRPPLVIAASRGHIAVVELLLASGADPVWESTNAGWWDIWISGLSQEHRWQVPDGSSYQRTRTALLYAIEDGHEEIVKVLLQAGADALDKDLPLAWAAMAEKTEIAKLLLDHGAAFELKNFGETPLSVAARYGKDSMVKLFIERGADIEAKDNSGRTPLSLAKTEEVAKTLIDAGADVNSEDNHGRSPLCWATDFAVIQLLLDAKANVNSGREVGRTPLIIAVKQSLPEKTRLLLQHGAEVDARDRRSRTSLLITAKSEDPNKHIMQFLLDNGADLEAEDCKGLTALSWAAWNRKTMAINFLLEKGASPTAFVGYRSYRRRRLYGWSRHDSESEASDSGSNSDEEYSKSKQQWYI